MVGEVYQSKHTQPNTLTHWRKPQMKNENIYDIVYIHTSLFR